MINVKFYIWFKGKIVIKSPNYIFDDQIFYYDNGYFNERVLGWISK